MLCRFWEEEPEKVDVNDGSCRMPIGPLPLWLQDGENAVDRAECTKPECSCPCYELKEKPKRTYPNPGMVKPLPVTAKKDAV